MQSWNSYLPVVVRRELVGVQPNSAGGGLAHFLALGCCDERCSQREQFSLLDTSTQIYPVDHVAPLVRAPHLQHTSAGGVRGNNHGIRHKWVNGPCSSHSFVSLPLGDKQNRMRTANHASRGGP